MNFDKLKPGVETDETVVGKLWPFAIRMQCRCCGALARISPKTIPRKISTTLGCLYCQYIASEHISQYFVPCEMYRGMGDHHME